MSKLLALLLLFLVVQQSLQVPEDDDDDDKGGKDTKGGKGGKGGKCGKGGKSRIKGFWELVKCKGLKDKTTLENVKAVKDDEAVKEFLVCAMKAFGMLDKEGVPQKDAIKHFLCRKGKTEAEANELVEKCVKKADSEEETAFSIYKCFKKNGVKTGGPGGGKKGGKKGGEKKADDE